MSSHPLAPPASGDLKQLDTQLCIHELFELQVARSPAAVAVSFGDQQLTYRDLDLQANQLAQYLRRVGVGPEVPVALYLDRSAWAAIAILGVLKAGGAYVPIDLTYPRDRVQFMLEDTQAPIVLTKERLLNQLPACRPALLCLDAQWRQIAAENKGRGVSQASADSAAYIIYTSGSTGTPKGVVVTHHNVVRLLQQTARWYQFNGNDVWPWFHSYAFDVSVWELWGCLFNGGRLIVIPYLLTRSPGDFYELLAHERVTVLNQTPSAFRQLIWAEQNAVRKLPLRLRYVICAGEALELQSLKPWFELHGDQHPQVVNMYGITETTVHSTFRIIRQADLSAGCGSVIGIPIPDLDIYLVDEELKPVLPGRPGEICVAGPGVARGYLNRPELTSQRFLPDTISGRPDGRMYRSGDLAQVNALGELEYLGRMDHQVKIRGFRVELGEIESALNQHPSIWESVVIPQDSTGGDKRLVAYVVPRPGLKGLPTVSDWREHLARVLPDYMIPAAFVVLERLPLTTNGKVDRRALPAPETTRPPMREPFVAPRTPLEHMLAAIWGDVLKVDRVGIHDNYFELGGDSILSIQILARMLEAGWGATVEQVFTYPTVAGLAGSMQSGAPATTPLATVPLSLVAPEDRAQLPEDVEDAYPISKLQQGMFYYNELHPASAMYHDVFTYNLRAAFDREKLLRSIQQLVRRHPILRTSFHLAGYSEPLQLVHRSLAPSLTIEDLRWSSTAAQDKAIADWVEAEKRRPFNRAQAPLCRFHAQRRADNEFQFFISFHHCCVDGWSLARMMTEICEEYSALLRGQTCRIPKPASTYREFIALEQETVSFGPSRRYWAEEVVEATPSLLPRWVGRATSSQYYEQMRGPELYLQDDVLSGLKALARSEGVPLKTVLLAGHQRVLSLLCSQSEIVTGLVSSGRPEVADGERVVGLFLNTVPLRQPLPGGSWRQLVRDTFRKEQELMPHRRMPLAEIQRIHSGRPLFETAFDFVHFHVLKELEDLPNLKLAEGYYFEANNLTTYTTLMVDVSATKLEVHIDYDPNTITRPQVEQMTRFYLAAYSAMAANPEARYETFSPLSKAESKQLLFDWNSTREEYPREQCLHEVIAARAAERPESVAVRFAGDAMAYRELEQKAAEIATRLRGAGVREGTLVAILVERSLEMIPCLLGIWKAGGSYLPLDPAYPGERLALMLQDSHAAVVLTQRALSRLLPNTNATVVCFDDPAPAPQEVYTNRSLETGSRLSKASETLAYVIYTSGSTGKPKGVQVTHRSVLNLLTSAARTTGIGSEDNLLAVTTLSFDIAGLELWMPLITGGAVTVAAREVTNDGVRLAELIENCGATVMQGTPATWRLLIEAGWKGNQNLKVFCGGEALKPALGRELLARASEVWNFYGPTETTIWSAAVRVLPDEPITIGRPLANTQLYILDAQRQPVPVGVTGELYIAGDGVARGYLNRPDLTAERFVANPFATDGGRMYKTGDLARYLPDGRVEFLGRMDDQVKIRGFRIEPGEVDSILRQHPGVADVVVTASEDGLGETRLVGYVKSRNGPVSSTSLRDYARSCLPLHMVPAVFVQVKQFPLTPNGKIDLKRLPKPEDAVERSQAYQAPRSPEEQGLAAIWEEVLKVGRIGLDDSFFDLGGDSLAATRAFARTNQAFGVALTLREMLEHSTIRALAQLVNKLHGTAQPAASLIPRRPRASAGSSDPSSAAARNASNNDFPD